jgi:DnaJ like chaperone protein|tara:strand:+ start:22693 stop:23439 length:747 start_codon:yes stop_codon:yes gene_type:complete
MLFGRSFLGGIIGFVIGTFVDNYQVTMERLKQQGFDPRNNRSSEDIFNFYRQQTSSNDFPTMLMALSAVVMKADGKVLKVELDYVKEFFSRQFGAQFSASHLQTLKRFLDEGNIPLQKICNDIKVRLQPEVRLQLMHYLYGIAKADGNVSQSEVQSIDHIAQMLGLNRVDYESIKNMFFRNIDSDFKVLGIDSSATEEEIKKAYRKMAIKFHPDKVSQMGEEYQKGAKEKFQEVQNAYENLKKQKGFK